MFVAFHTLNELPKGSKQVREEYKDSKSEDIRQDYITKVREFRKNFELPCWPYNDQDHMDHFKEFLRDLGIIYYDDGISEDGGKKVGGGIFPYEPEFYKDLVNVTGYLHRVHLHKEIEDIDLLYTPMKWPYESTPGGISMKNQIMSDPIMSDELAWGEMNSETLILSINYGRTIRYKKIKKESIASQPYDTSRFSKKGKPSKQEKTEKGWIDAR